MAGYLAGEVVLVTGADGGIRPWEKLYEKILTVGEGVNATSLERIYIARPEEFDAAGLKRFLWLVSQPGCAPMSKAWRKPCAWSCRTSG
ncbi:hypothetical protein [Moorella sp. Hama-1]|uniref:hypothetical protein n=1 Tax=Moorella sp. Hama-1 TaxID=2138101 RepID=UPI000D642B11|nr:hypothetical protein [Moorella sp. Hama-1]BCV20694.1 hypothetical protein hamaS1_07630 [Moorella sp. Hama-1]